MEKKTIAQRVQEWIGTQDKACIQETVVSLRKAYVATIC